MKKISLVIILSVLTLFFINCGNTYNINTADNVYGSTMYTDIEKNMSKTQFDSLCLADKINNNLSNWIKTQYYDGETYTVLTQYLFIKTNNNVETIYRVQLINDSLWVSKRIKK